MKTEMKFARHQIVFILSMLFTFLHGSTSVRHMFIVQLVFFLSCPYHSHHSYTILMAWYVVRNIRLQCVRKLIKNHIHTMIYNNVLIFFFRIYAISNYALLLILDPFVVGISAPCYFLMVPFLHVRSSLKTSIIVS